MILYINTISATISQKKCGWCSSKWTLRCNVSQVSDFISDSSNTCLLRTGKACCSYCLPLLICPPRRHTGRNSHRQVCVCEYAYFSCVWQWEPGIALAVHPTPASRGDWCGGSDVEHVEPGEAAQTAQPASQLPAISHMWSQRQRSSQEPDSFQRAGHKIQLLGQNCKGFLAKIKSWGVSREIILRFLFQDEIFSIWGGRNQ